MGDFLDWCGSLKMGFMLPICWFAEMCGTRFQAALGFGQIILMMQFAVKTNWQPEKWEFLFSGCFYMGRLWRDDDLAKLPKRCGILQRQPENIFELRFSFGLNLSYSFSGCLLRCDVDWTILSNHRAKPQRQPESKTTRLFKTRIMLATALHSISTNRQSKK